MVDLDYFKILNDTLGHDAGDQVLKIVAHTLIHATRTQDAVCRFGGEEFFILMTGGTIKDYLTGAGDLKTRITALDILWQGVSVGPITVSLAIAGFPVHANTLETLVHKADQALYCAKKQGRNRVVCVQL